MSNRVPIQKKLVLLNSFSFLVAHAINLLVMVWVVGYLYNLIPDTEFQVLAVILSLRGLIMLGMGIITAGLARHVIAAYAVNDGEEITRITTSLFIACIFLAGILSVAALIGSWYVDLLLADNPGDLSEARLSMALLLVSSALLTAFTPFRVGYQVKQKYVAANMIWLVSTVVRAGLMVILILGIGPSVLWVVVASVAAQALQTGWLVIGSLAMVPEMRPKISFYNKQTIFSQLVFGTWSSIGSLAALIRQSSDPILLARLASARDVNLFFVGSLADRNIRGALTQAVQPILPVLTAMHVTDQHHRIQNTLIKGSRWLLWFGLFIAAPLMVYRQEIMTLYLWQKPESVDGAATVMLLLLFCWIPGFAFNLGPRVAMAKADVKPLNLRMVIVQGINLGLTAVLLAGFGWGAIGSATATVIAEFVLAPLLLWSVVLKMVDLPWRRFIFETMLPGVTPLALAGIACEMLRNWVPPQGLILLMDHLLPEVMSGSFGEALKEWFPTGGILILVLNIFLLWALYGLGILMVYTKSDKADFKKLFMAKLSKRGKKPIDNTLELSRDE